jgi:hypothetical protein
VAETSPSLNKNLQGEKKEVITVPRAIGIGAGLPTTLEAPKLLEITYEKLSSPTDPRNTFEVGIHVTRKNQTDYIYDEFERGNPNAHMWYPNPELGNRLISVAPQVLTIDGLSPTPSGQTLNKKNLWVAAPCRPRTINQLGYYSVSADIGEYRKIGKELSTQGKIPYDAKDEMNLNQASDDDAYNSVFADYYLNTLESQSQSEGTKIRSGILLGLAGYALSKLSSKEKAQSVTRRTFLKGIAGTAAWMGTTGIIDSLQTHIQKKGATNAASSLTEKQKDLYQILLSLTDNVPPDIYMDGRTAMIIAKHEDAMDFLRKHKYLQETAKGAIVMGRDHAYKADLYMRDKTARDAAILAFAKHAIGITSKIIYDRYKIPAAQRGQLTNYLLDYFSQVEINYVSDPGIPPRTKLTHYIDTNIQPVRIISSSQVENAIKFLRHVDSTASTH